MWKGPRTLEGKGIGARGHRHPSLANGERCTLQVLPRSLTYAPVVGYRDE